MSRTMTSTGPTLTAPRWAGDYMNREHLVPGGAKVVASLFVAPDAVSVVVGAAGAAAAATSVPVAALSGPIPSGTVLNFGTNKFARLTAAAATGATTLTVAAIPTALVSGDTATYAGILPRSIPSGTAVGRTIAERDAGTGYGPAAAADDEIFLTAEDITDATKIDDVTLYRPGGIVKENFLPVLPANMIAGVVTKLRVLYQMTIGV